jgi:hypothetical protein
VHSVEELLALLGGGRGIARGERACDAVVHMLVEDLVGEALERGRDAPICVSTSMQ